MKKLLILLFATVFVTTVQAQHLVPGAECLTGPASTEKTKPMPVDVDIYAVYIYQPGDRIAPFFPQTQEKLTAEVNTTTGFVDTKGPQYPPAKADKNSLEKFVVRQQTIDDFIKKYADTWIHEGAGTYFLKQENGELYIVTLEKDNNGVVTQKQQTLKKAKIDQNYAGKNILIIIPKENKST